MLLSVIGLVKKWTNFPNLYSLGKIAEIFVTTVKNESRHHAGCLDSHLSVIGLVKSLTIFMEIS